MKKLTKKLLALAFAAAMLAMLCLSVSAADFKGAGTKADPYLIETAEQFAAMIQSVTDGKSTYTDQYFLQTADLDFTGVTYIINEMNPFDGIYNGQGYVLKNLNITKEYGNDPYNEGNEYMAPFGYVSGVLMNVGIDNSSVNDAYCGAGLVRKAKEGAVIVNCYSNADVTGSNRGTGLVEYINSHDVVVANCYYGGIASGNALVGSAWNGDQSVLDMCYYVEGKSAGSAPIGKHEAVADANAADFVAKLNGNRAAAAALAGIDVSDLVEWTVGEKAASFVKPVVKAPETQTPETTAPVVTPNVPAAPQTFDMGVIAAAAAVISAAGYAISKKRK